MPMPLPPGKQLAVPPMHPNLDPDTREQILDYVNRRMFVEAVNLAGDAEYERQRGHQPPTAYARAAYTQAATEEAQRRSRGELEAYDPDDLPEFVDAVPAQSAEDMRDQHIGKDLMDRARTLAKTPSTQARFGANNPRARRATSAA